MKDVTKMLQKKVGIRGKDDVMFRPGPRNALSRAASQIMATEYI